MKKWQILKRKLILNERYKRVEKQLVKTYDGQTAEWFVELLNPVVGVFAVTKEGKILINRQYKHGAGNIVYEIPHGIVEKDESLPDAAQRELLEETGYRVGELKKIGQYFMQPTGTNGVIHVFFGKNGEKVTEGHGDPHEKIDVLLVEPEKLVEWAIKGKINTQTGLAGVFLGLEYLKKSQILNPNVKSNPKS